MCKVGLSEASGRTPAFIDRPPLAQSRARLFTAWLVRLFSADREGLGPPSVVLYRARCPSSNHISEPVLHGDVVARSACGVLD